MLSTCSVVAFVATTQPDRARVFYGDVLGFPLIEDGPFAIVYDAGGTMLRVSKVKELAPAPFTVLGWKVPNIHDTVAMMGKRGIKFERYPGLPQDESGIWITPDGSRVCWFKDPDGNTLSLTQFR